jgi:single-strand DNA-binding protein
MAGSVNKCILVGNVGADPEIRRTQDGKPIANLRIATSETWRDKTTGERKEKTEWHRVVVFSEGICKIVEQYVKKGAKLYIEGSLQTRKWTDKDNIERYSTEVVVQAFGGTLTMLDGPKGDREVPDDIKPPMGNAPRTFGAGTRKTSDDMDDNIPFAAEWR